MSKRLFRPSSREKPKIKTKTKTRGAHTEVFVLGGHRDPDPDPDRDRDRDRDRDPDQTGETFRFDCSATRENESGEWDVRCHDFPVDYPSRGATARVMELERSLSHLRSGGGGSGEQKQKQKQITRLQAELAHLSTQLALSDEEARKHKTILQAMMKDSTKMPDNFPTSNPSDADEWLKLMVKTEKKVLEEMNDATKKLDVAQRDLSSSSSSSSASPEELRAAKRSLQKATADQDMIMNVLAKHPAYLKRLRRERNEWLDEMSQHLDDLTVEWQSLLPENLETITFRDWKSWMATQPMTLWNGSERNFGPIYADYFVNTVEKNKFKNLLICFKHNKINKQWMNDVDPLNLIQRAQGTLQFPSQLLFYAIVRNANFSETQWSKISPFHEAFLLSMKDKFKNEPVPTTILPQLAHRKKTMWNYDGAILDAEARGKAIKDLLDKLKRAEFEEAYNHLLTLSPGNNWQTDRRRLLETEQNELQPYFRGILNEENKIDEKYAWITMRGDLKLGRATTKLHQRVYRNMKMKIEFYKYLYWRLSKTFEINTLETLETQALFYLLLDQERFDWLNSIESHAQRWEAFCSPYSTDELSTQESFETYAIQHGLKEEGVGWTKLGDVWAKAKAKTGESESKQTIVENWNVWRAGLINRVFDRLYKGKKQHTDMMQLTSTYIRPEADPKDGGGGGGLGGGGGFLSGIRNMSKSKSNRSGDLLGEIRNMSLSKSKSKSKSNRRGGPVKIKIKTRVNRRVDPAVGKLPKSTIDTADHLADLKAAVAAMKPVGTWLQTPSIHTRI